MYIFIALTIVVMGKAEYKMYSSRMDTQGVRDGNSGTPGECTVQSQK